MSFTTDLTSCLDNVEVIFSSVGTLSEVYESADLRYVPKVARARGNINDRKELKEMRFLFYRIG